ncbi:MAG: zinc ABC transporter permease, partial [Candidatus Hydrogenedentota bacterium]
MLLQRAGLSNAKAFVWAFIAAGLTTLAAAVLSAPVAAGLSDAVLGDVFAVVAGIMLHVGATHLLSHAGEGGWARATPVVLLGAAAALAITQ